MHDFVLKEIKNTDIKFELEKIGFDKSYINKACEKFGYLNIKLFQLSVAQANILKQTAISVGADCATHRETITGKVETTDCILGGSFAQINKIAKKLASQPFGLKILGEKIINFIPQNSVETKIVGVLNLTTDSFSDGGEFFEPENAIKRLNQMIEEGADIVDIGAESTKPYSKAVAISDQLEKLVPILERGISIPVSVDTRSAEVAEKCIEHGASIINDVSGLEYDSRMVDVVSKYGIKIVIQHSKGTPDIMQESPRYDNLMGEIYLSLKERIDFALSKGVKLENIIVDPGIGFGKSREDNFEIIERIEELRGLGCPIMLGISRKSLLGMSNADNFTKDIYTLALNAKVMGKIDYIRVHNVELHRTLISIFKH